MNFAFVPNLDRIMDHEFVLLRPLSVTPGAAATVANTVLASLTYDAAVQTPAGRAAEEGIDMAPLDSFDFTGLSHPDYNGGLANAWHYVRANPDPHVLPANNTSAGGNNKQWHFVYPGRYDATKSSPDPANELQRPRQQGTDEAFTGGAPGFAMGDPNPWEKVDDGTGTFIGAPPSPGFSFGRGESETGEEEASYPREFAIQIQAVGFGAFNPPFGPSSVAGAAGAFMRNGDMLQVPYIGAYRLKLTGTQTTAPMYNEILELNALPMDATFAEDSDPNNDPQPADAAAIPGGSPEPFRREQIGRFCPLPATDLSVAARGTLDDRPVDALSLSTVRDLERTISGQGNNYWAGGPGSPNSTPYDLVVTNGPFRGESRTVIGFDAATGDITCYPDLPDPAVGLPAGTSYELRRGTYRWATDLFDHLTVRSPHDDLVVNDSSIAPNQPVSNYGAQANSAAEATAPVEGLINLNTASWRVLASVPWTRHNTDGLSYHDQFQRRTAAPLVFVPGMIVPDSNTAPPAGQPVENRSIQDNYDIARAIVAFRDSEIAAGADPNRVFTSIFDLYRIPGILLFSDGAMSDPVDRDDDNGDVSPPGQPADPANPTPAELATLYNLRDGVRGDFEEQFLFLNRISNLVTTRSDSFTNYIIVQGWRGIGTANPELVVQRRKAFMSDRSAATAASKDVATEFFYND
jgi:hypothetical protein